MTKMTYGEQLKHPNWQRKRLEVLERADFHCERCGDGETTLHVHHKHYVKGRMAWEYENSELTALCEPCHQAEHEHRELLDRLLLSPDASVPMAIGLLAGYLDGMCSLPEELEADVKAASALSGPYFMAGSIGQFLESRNWRFVGQALNAFVANHEYTLNPAEEGLIKFLCSLPAPAKDL